MTQEKYTLALVGITVVLIFILVSISGCTSNQNTNETGTQLSGTWVGTVDMSLSGGRGNTSVTQIIFTGSNAEMTLNSEQRSFTMNYTFTANGNTMIFEPKFNDRGGFPGQPSQNGTRSWNDTSRPPMMNGTGPNGTQLPPGGQQPPNGEQPSMTISFEYSLNEGHTILYLNGSQFIKIQ